MWQELKYSIDTYPGLYVLWFMALLSWLFAAALLVWQLAHARSVSRTRGLSRRFLSMVWNSVVQLPIWRHRLGGAMHLGLFLGGILLSLGFILSHYLTPRGEAWRSSGGIHLMNDAGLLLLLIGLILAVWRRHVRHRLPARAEDVALWGFLSLGALLILLSQASLLAIADPKWREQAFLSNVLSGILDGLPLSMRRSLYGWSWSVSHVWLWGAVIVLPWSKWRHMFLAPISLLTRREAPLARLDALDLENDAPYGARSLNDLTWKERLDLEACTRCGRCTRVCPVHLVGRDLDPLALIETLRSSDGVGPLAKQVNEAVLWDCTTCMACDDICPLGISPLDMILDLRRERVLEVATFPQPLHRVFTGLERRGNPWGLDAKERAAWLDSLGLAQLAPGESCQVLLWLGCMGSYDERARRAVRALVRLLQKADVDVATLGIEEGCCGDTARRAGNEHLWREAALANIAVLGTRRVGRIVSLCPHCVNTLANEYGALGANLDVAHASAFLAELVYQGKLSLDTTRSRDDGRRIAYHDPCYLGRGNGQFEAARQLIAVLPGVKLVELDHHGRDALCCGAGGGQMWLDEPGKPSLGALRAGEIAEAAVTVCATACPYCASMLSDSLAAMDREESVEVRDLVELLADLCPPQHAGALTEHHQGSL